MAKLPAPKAPLKTGQQRARDAIDYAHALQEEQLRRNELTALQKDHDAAIAKGVLPTALPTLSEDMSRSDIKDAAGKIGYLAGGKTTSARDDYGDLGTVPNQGGGFTPAQMGAGGVVSPTNPTVSARLPGARAIDALGPKPPDGTPAAADYADKVLAINKGIASPHDAAQPAEAARGPMYSDGPVNRGVANENQTAAGGQFRGSTKAEIQDFFDSDPVNGTAAQEARAKVNAAAGKNEVTQTPFGTVSSRVAAAGEPMTPTIGDRSLGPQHPSPRDPTVPLTPLEKVAAKYPDIAKPGSPENEAFAKAYNAQVHASEGGNEGTGEGTRGTIDPMAIADRTMKEVAQSGPGGDLPTPEFPAGKGYQSPGTKAGEAVKGAVQAVENAPDAVTGAINKGIAGAVNSAADFATGLYGPGAGEQYVRHPANTIIAGLNKGADAVGGAVKGSVAALMGGNGPAQPAPQQLPEASTLAAQKDTRTPEDQMGERNTNGKDVIGTAAPVLGGLPPMPGNSMNTRPDPGTATVPSNPAAPSATAPPAAAPQPAANAAPAAPDAPATPTADAGNPDKDALRAQVDAGTLSHADYLAKTGLVDARATSAAANAPTDFDHFGQLADNAVTHMPSNAATGGTLPDVQGAKGTQSSRNGGNDLDQFGQLGAPSAPVTGPGATSPAGSMVASAGAGGRNNTPGDDNLSTFAQNPEEDEFQKTLNNQEAA